MDRFLFLKEHHEDLYALCCEITRLQEQNNIDALFKCRQVLENIASNCGATKEFLAQKINELNDKGVLDSYMVSLFYKISRYGNDSTHIEKITNAANKEFDVSRLQDNISYIVDLLYEACLWFEVGFCHNDIPADLLTDEGKKLVAKYQKKEETCLIDPLVINSYIPDDADEDVDYRERDVFETQAEYEERFAKYQEVISKQQITIGYVLIDNYDEIAGVSMPKFGLNRDLNLNGEILEPPHIDAIVIPKNNYKEEYRDNEYEIVVNLKIEKDFYSPIELNTDTMRIRISEDEECQFDYIDDENKISPAYILPLGNAYPIRKNYNIDNETLPWNCTFFNYIQSDIPCLLLTHVDRDNAKKLCSSKEGFKMYGSIKNETIALLTNPEYGTFYFGKKGNLVDVKLPNSVYDAQNYSHYNEFVNTPFYTDLKQVQENVEAEAKAEAKAKAKTKAEAKALAEIKPIIERNFSFCERESTHTVYDTMETIKIPNGVTRIGDYAFYGCTSLQSITIPNSVTSIGDSAFRGCTSLQSITIPNSVTEIGNLAFDGCTSLQSIIIPDSVTSIGAWAFDRCTSLQSITIPNSVTSIGDSAFYGCTSLQSITIPDSVTSIGSCTFYGCTSLQSITIPNSVTSIGDSAFDGCTSLQSITIPDSVTKIGDKAFNSCHSIEILHCDKCFYRYFPDDIPFFKIEKEKRKQEGLIARIKSEVLY